VTTIWQHWISPFPVQFFLLPFSYHCSNAKYWFQRLRLRCQTFAIKLRYLRNSAFYRAPFRKGTCSCLHLTIWSVNNLNKIWCNASTKFELKSSEVMKW